MEARGDENMGKGGMRRGAFFNFDPTYTAVLGKFNKEAKEARKRKEAMKPFRLIATIHKLAAAAGYRIAGDLTIKNSVTGEIYISRHVGR